MIKFIKQLLGFGNSQETVKEIVTPPASTAADLTVANATGNVPLVGTYIAPAKPVNKVRAVGETGAAAIKAATAPKPANKKRRPYCGNKNAGGTVAKITEGNTKGGNGTVKQQPAQSKKPQAPKKSK